MESKLASEALQKINAHFIKLSENQCSSHNDFQAEYICTHDDCISNSKSYLCELCIESHYSNYSHFKHIKSINILFSNNILDKAKKVIDNIEKQMKQDAYTREASNRIDQIFDEFQRKLVSNIYEYCKTVKQNILNKIDPKLVQYKQMSASISQYESMLESFFLKDELPELKIFISKYSEEYRNLSDIIQTNFNKMNSKDPASNDIKNALDKLSSKCTEYDKEISKFIVKRISTLEEDVTFDNKDLIDRLKNMKIEKDSPRIHSATVWKIMNNNDNTKYITCSDDNTIIVRNIQTNEAVQILKFIK